MLIEFPTADAIPEAARCDGAPWSMRWLCDGEVRTWTGEGADVRSPVCLRAADGSLTRAVIGRLPMVSAEAALQALDAAKRAWNRGRGAWPTMRTAKRVAVLEKFASGMVARREEVVRLLMWEIGKTRKDSETEFDRTVVYVRDTLEALKAIDRDGSRFMIEAGTLGQIRRSPLGVTLCMGPFNYPLNETFTTMIPALAMGNTVVCKLPRYGGLLLVPLFEAFASAFPPGVVNIFQGDGATTIGPIMASGDIDALAFIGSSRVANLLRMQHPRPNRMRCITGLEAKNPGVVLPDADLDLAVKECVSGALSFNGQRCTALKLLLVHDSIATAFVDKLAAAVAALKAGMPWSAGTQLTPLPEDGKIEWLQKLVADAVDKGARVITGGETEATFFRPAVLYPVAPAAQLYTQEQFGPVVPVATFSSDAEIDAFMQASPYGQQVALFGRDPQRMAGLVDALVNQVSRINLNTQCRRGPDSFPFTGRKDSAEGTLSVHDALRCFSIRTVVAAQTDNAGKQLVENIVSGRLSSFLSTDYIL